MTAEQASAGTAEGPARARSSAIAPTRPVVVAVERTLAHPLYGKQISQRKKYHAHDENNDYRSRRYRADRRDTSAFEDSSGGASSI